MDADGDGLHDESDICPELAEDLDGFQDDDGCPDPDNDLDGVLDVDDACPMDSEDFDLHRDDDGCPDEDNDDDGVPDATDLCPAEGEDSQGSAPSDGCLIPRYDRWAVTLGPPQGKVRVRGSGRIRLRFGSADIDAPEIRVGVGLHRFGPYDLIVGDCGGDCDNDQQYVGWNYRGLALTLDAEYQGRKVWLNASVGPVFSSHISPTQSGPHITGPMLAFAMGVRLFGWPHAGFWSRGSLINLSVGARSTALFLLPYSSNPDGGGTGASYIMTVGPMLVNDTLVGPVVLRFQVVFPVHTRGATSQTVTELSCAVLARF